jgi:hypothetical protein
MNKLEGNQCSLDIETVGTKPGCAIVSIGAVSFNASGVTRNTYYKELSVKSQLALDLRMNPETLAWWLEQSIAAQTSLRTALTGGAELGEALDEFSLWYRQQGFNAVWARGASFDFAILATAAQRARRELPWKFWEERCQRTLTALFPEVPQPLRLGTYHNALDDAGNQAQHIVDIYAAQAPRDTGITHRGDQAITLGALEALENSDGGHCD